jgi:hypothetical protein
MCNLFKYLNLMFLYLYPKLHFWPYDSTNLDVLSSICFSKHVLMLISRVLVQGGVLSIKSPKQLQMAQRHISLLESPIDKVIGWERLC